MNVFSNILLTAISMLYLSIVSDARCACLRPETIVPARLLNTRNGQCSMDLRSRSTADRQICPSRSKINFDPKRTPKYLIEKSCCHQECPAGVGYRCVEYRVPIGVTYHDVDAEGRVVFRPEMIHLSVTCVCVAPRVLPTPPRK